MKKAHKDPIDLDNQIENLIFLGFIKGWKNLLK